jgi:hypothetical protein
MIFRTPTATLAIAPILIGVGNLRAQDTAVTRLEPVLVEVGRGEHRSVLDLPFAVTVQTPDSMRPGQRHL